MPGLLGDRHWFGVLTPSVDRVGRQFPLTFAASFAPGLVSLNEWWSVLVGVAMRAKEANCDIDMLESVLLDIHRDRYLGQAAESFEQRLLPALAVAERGASLWWSWRAGAPGDETLWVLEDLPRGQGFLRLITPS
jgi:hypothetical protein